MSIRTDLAVEATLNRAENLNGVRQSEFEKNGLKVIKTKLPKSAESLIGKKAGDYVTVYSKELFSGAESEKYIEVLAELLRDMIKSESGLVLVVGLGNEHITPDALGPQVCEKILATRHLSELTPEICEDLRAVASLATGVLGQTGIESAEIIKAVCDKIKPSAVIAVDALAASDVERLLTTVQFSNTGIQPGAGVLNKRAELSQNTLGVPVIALGVPTVVDAYSIKETSGEKRATLMVTPKDIDIKIKRAAEILALAVNSALQERLSVEEISFLNC